MRIFSIVLGCALILLQSRLWVSEQGMREVSRLQAAIDAQSGANRDQAERNRQLSAEVNDLKLGLTAIEERARSELGMVGSNEPFFQLVTPGPGVNSPPAVAITARAE